jgi:DNA-binding IclR family transcriptional regulator
MSVKSAVRVLAILELVGENPQGLTAKEISAALGYPASSTFQLVKTLHEHGYLSQLESLKYRLGPKLIPLGNQAMEQMDLYRDARPYLSKLMEQVQETVFMAILSGDEMVYVDKVDNNRSIRTTAEIGSRKPMYCTGLGKAMLAFLPGEHRARILAHTPLKALTENTIVDPEKLQQVLEQTKKQGYAIDDEENEEGLYCIASPLFDSKGQVVAAVSVAGPKERMQRRHDFILEHLTQTTKSISSDLGYLDGREV